MATIFTHKPIIEGQRVRLRPVDVQDAPIVHRLLQDAEAAILTGTVHCSNETTLPWTVDELRVTYERWSSAEDRLVLAVIDRATNAMVGEVVLNDWNESNRSCSFRTFLGAEGRGRGLGTEATDLIVRYGIRELGLHRIALEVYAFNPRARHVYEKVGFRFEGTGRDALWFDGRWVDVHYMSILEGDIGLTTLEARPPAGAAGEDPAVVLPAPSTVSMRGCDDRPLQDDGQHPAMAADSPVQCATASDGTRLAWRSVGSGHPLLLISGQAVDSTSWDALLPALGERFRVITFDHRGTGQSTAGPDEGYTTESFARDAIAVLDAAGIDRAHVYGHSMGGRVAQWIAINHASRVSALVLGATTAGDERGTPRSAQATRDLAVGNPDRIAALFFRSGERRADARAFFNQTASRHARRLHRAASRTHDAWDRLADITSPTLVIHGTDDEMTPPANAERIAAAVPGAELELLDGARHGYYLEDPRATDRVIGFLGRHS